MNKQEISNYIVHRLSDGDLPDEVIFSICEKTNLVWSDAAVLVKQVQAEKEGVIARKQMPLLFALALAIFLGGVGLLGYALLVTTTAFSEVRIGEVDSIAQVGMALANIIVGSNGMVLYAFLTGIGMILGSLLGLRNAWASILSE